MKTLTGVISALVVATSMPGSVKAQNTTAITCGQAYTVASGDTLSGISLRAYGSFEFHAIYDLNVDTIGRNPNLIFVGQVLQIPCLTADGDTQEDEIDLDLALVTEDDPEAAELPPVAPEDQIVLTFNKASAPDFIINSGIINPYLAEITEVTGGRVTFVDPKEVNRDPAAQYELVVSGEVDGAYVFNGLLAESHPLLQLPMLPLMGGSAEQTATALWRLHENHLSKTDYFDELELMGFIAAPAAHIWRLDTEPVAPGQGIGEINDYPVPYFDGLDTRGPALVRGEVAERLLSYNEEENGTLTFLMAHGAARAAGIWNDRRTVTEVDAGMYTPTFSVVFSKDAWARLSQKDRSAIRTISGERLAARAASWDAFDNGHRQHMLETGLDAVKVEGEFLAELVEISKLGLATWTSTADAYGVAGIDALNGYRADLDSLRDRLLFR